MIAHGTKDHIYPVARMREFAGTLRKGGQKVRLLVFSSGYHGTPLRMIDWRKELNWLLSQS